MSIEVFLDDVLGTHFTDYFVDNYCAGKALRVLWQLVGLKFVRDTEFAGFFRLRLRVLLFLQMRLKLLFSVEIASLTDQEVLFLGFWLESIDRVFWRVPLQLLIRGRL